MNLFALRVHTNTQYSQLQITLFKLAHLKTSKQTEPVGIPYSDLKTHLVNVLGGKEVGSQCYNLTSKPIRDSCENIKTKALGLYKSNTFTFNGLFN